MGDLFKAKVKRLYDEYYSFLFIPDDGKPFFEFKLKKIFIYITLFLIVSSTIYSLFMTQITVESYSDLSNKISETSYLTVTTRDQKEHIQDLKSEFEKINEKIFYLNELEMNIRNIVGLQNQTVATVQVSRSSDARSFNELQDRLDNASIYISQKSDENLNLEALEINSQLDSKIDEMNKLIKEVEERLKYLEAYPDRWPTYGRISSYYGWRTHPIYKNKDFHTGIDIANSYGTSIVASGSGKVTYSGYKNGYGKVIIINHGYGYQTLYGHNSKLLVNVGDYVNKGQVIAKMGSTGTSTGNHCHFEVIQNNKTINPLTTLK